MKTQLVIGMARRCSGAKTSSGLVHIRTVTTARHRVPSEHEPHLCTLMAYPSAKSLPDHHVLADARRDIVRIATAIAKFEPVVLFASAGDALENAGRDIEQSKSRSSFKSAQTEKYKNNETLGYKVIPQEMNLDELWIRDTGPIFAISQESKRGSAQHLTGLDFNFNNWGAKLEPLGPDYFDFSLAERITRRASRWMASALECFDVRNSGQVSKQQNLLGTRKLTGYFRSRLTAEGGNIEISSDGRTLLIVRAAIVNANRNPGCDMNFISSRLKEDLGVEQIIWLDGAEGTDITDTHVDALARFVPGPRDQGNDASHVVLSRPAPYALKERQQAYRSTKTTLRDYDAHGDVPRRFAIHELQEPKMDLIEEAYNETFSYANFYLVNNEGLLLPQFGGEASDMDQKAYETICHVFPDRHVVQVQLDTLPRIGGGIHCATQQVPMIF